MHTSLFCFADDATAAEPTYWLPMDGGLLTDQAGLTAAWTAEW